jgi:hypothetical protein
MHQALTFRVAALEARTDRARVGPHEADHPVEGVRAPGQALSFRLHLPELGGLLPRHVGKVPELETASPDPCDEATGQVMKTLSSEEKENKQGALTVALLDNGQGGAVGELEGEPRGVLVGHGLEEGEDLVDAVLALLSF